MSGRSPYASSSGVDLLPTMQSMQLHQLMSLARSSATRPSFEDRALEDKLLTPHPQAAELQHLSLQQLLQLAKATMQRDSLSPIAVVEEAQAGRQVSDSEAEKDPAAAAAAASEPQGGMVAAAAAAASGVWREAVEMLQIHSSEIAHDMKNPLNGVLALSQNVVAGVFGELPQAAVDQINVVRSCAYHLLNMINMTRDMMKVKGPHACIHAPSFMLPITGHSKTACSLVCGFPWAQMLASGDAETSLNITTLENPVEEVIAWASVYFGD